MITSEYESHVARRFATIFDDLEGTVGDQQLLLAGLLTIADAIHDVALALSDK